MADTRAELDAALGKLREVRALLEAIDGKSNLTDKTGPTALGHVVSAITVLERRKGLLR